MRKIISSVTLLMCLTSSASAIDMNSARWDRFLEHNSLTRKIGWDQKNLDVQTRSTGHLIVRIKKLELENEQLRNSISLIRAGKTSYGMPAPDPRIQGLIDENKRLTAQIGLNRVQQGPSASDYLRQINILKSENQKLSHQIEKLNVETAMNMGPGGGIMDDTSVLKAYIEENQLLKEALNQRDNGTKRIVLLQQQIENLKAENSKLKLSVSLDNGIFDDNDIFDDDDAILENDAEIASLKKELMAAQEENREMSMALVETAQKAFDSDKNAGKATDAYENNLKAVGVLKQRLSKAYEKNNKLQAKLKLAAAKDISGETSSEGIKALRQQNESLRETIKAQSESLHSADNATKTAERLITENSNLQHKLDLARNSHSMDGKTTQKMLKRIKTLEKKVMQRDGYIKKMLASKADELAVLSKSDTPNATGHIALLREKNTALIKALDKEKESNIAYRRKISEYQKEFEHAKKLEKASSSGVHRASIFERHVKTLEQKQQQSENTVAVLKLENQELKARLKLLVAQQTGESEGLNKIQPATGGRLNSSSLIDPNTKGYEKGVTFFDADYPITEERILPFLDEDKEEKADIGNGAKAAINEDVTDMFEDSLAVNQTAINSETLLATELTSLSEATHR